jgi:glutaredoxin
MRRTTRSTWAAVAIFALLFVGAAAPIGCSHKKDDGTAPVGESKSLPALIIQDNTPDLMLTWIDDKGDLHVEIHPADVPPSGRAPVRVVVSDREDGTKDVFYVVDLNHKGTDGYTAQTMSRRAWEDEIDKRRQAYLAKVAPPPATPAGSGAAGAPAGPQAPADRPPSGALTVIIYGASWCRPCHQAEAYLKSRGIAVVMKDIDESPGAAAEMREKLERSGQHGGSIPVIDVRGQILVGYSASQLDRALAKAQSGTVL